MKEEKEENVGSTWLLERRVFGAFCSLLKKMKLNDIEGYKDYLRMTEENVLEINTSFNARRYRKTDTIIRVNSSRC